MQLCLGVKTLQSAVSVMCQISYLVSNSDLHDPTTSPQAKALFGLNIAVSMMTVIMGVVMLFLKDSLLRSVKRKSVVDLKPEIELSNDIDYTDNPLHNSDQVSNKTTQERDDVSVEVLKTRVEVLEEDNIDKQSQIEDSKEKNAELKEENEDKQDQIKELLKMLYR